MDDTKRSLAGRAAAPAHLPLSSSAGSRTMIMTSSSPLQNSLCNAPHPTEDVSPWIVRSDSEPSA